MQLSLAPTTTTKRQRPDEERTAAEESAYRQQVLKINTLYREWVKEALEEGVDDQNIRSQMDQWMNTIRNDPDDLRQKLEFFNDFGKRQRESAQKLRATFYEKLEGAKRSGVITENSYQKWIKRFHDPTTSFKSKEYWVERQMPNYIQAWKKVIEKRQKLLDENLEILSALKKKDPQLNMLRTRGIDVDALLQKEKFLDLHFEKKEDLLKRAKTLLLLMKINCEDLYQKCCKILTKPVRDKVISQDRVGELLSRILTGNKTRKEIETFLQRDIHVLIAKRYAVKSAYDAIRDKIKMRGSNRARGLCVIAEDKFLKMNYKQRLAYVTETKQRLLDANDIKREHPAFLRIRHGLDTKDWKSAANDIAHAEKLSLSEKDKKRLESMKIYLQNMRTLRKKIGKKNTEKKENDPDAIIAREKKIMKETGYSSCLDIIQEMEKAPKPSDALGKWSWIAYNNVWCRKHNYLDQAKMMKGCRKENEQATHDRAKRGEDVGRNDVIGAQTADNMYFRKEEHGKNRATFLHLKMNSPAARMGFAHKLQQPMNPKYLYWTTFCAHEDGMPKPDEWHTVLMKHLYTLRNAYRKKEEGKSTVHTLRLNNEQKKEEKTRKYKLAIAA